MNASSDVVKTWINKTQTKAKTLCPATPIHQDEDPKLQDQDEDQDFTYKDKTNTWVQNFCL